MEIAIVARKAAQVLRAVLVLLLFAACTGANQSAAPASAPSESGASQGAAQTGPTQTVTITGLDTFKFDPATIAVIAGQPVALRMDNKGQTLHDFTLSDGVVAPVQLVEGGGKSGTVTFTITKPGTYKFVCAQPGHQQAGMVGSIVAR